jgi:hypothetical protein
MRQAIDRSTLPDWVRQQLAIWDATNDGKVALWWAAKMLRLTTSGLVKRARRAGIGQEAPGAARLGKHWILSTDEFLRLAALDAPLRGNPRWRSIPGAASHDGWKGYASAANAYRRLKECAFVQPPAVT